jgi:transcriptional regulator with PAS, ATPase and Fis domain
VAASSGAPVLITGETGTGKTLLARWIHYNGARSDEPFVSLNCAALPETLAESELFGHEKGAFTGATGPRRGVFEMAERGTVLLDEIGAMPAQLQAKLLGVLEHRSLRRLGSETERPVQALVVAATNSDLESAIREGSFRKDLYFRLGVIHIGLPPLRDRLDDLPDLCRHLTRSIAGHEVPLADGELARLAAYPWPGNVRELASVLERALLIQSGDRLAPSALLAGSASALPASPQREAAGETGRADDVLPLETVERQHIERTLAHYRGNLTRTAAALGIALSTLKRKVKDSGLGPARRE